VLGDLDFLTVLGKGSFGTVVLCRRPKDENLYAMKVSLYMLITSTGIQADDLHDVGLDMPIMCVWGVMTGVEEVSPDRQAPDRPDQDGEGDPGPRVPPLHHDHVLGLPDPELPLHDARLLQASTALAHHHVSSGETSLTL
jgi:hypothetical protein